MRPTGHDTDHIPASPLRPGGRHPGGGRRPLRHRFLGRPGGAGRPAEPAALGAPPAESTTALPPTTVPSTTAPATPAPAVPVPQSTTANPVTLRPGDAGDEVLSLQHRLQALGYWLGTADGNYGSLTEQAVTAFQKVEGLQPEGIAGPDTAGALA